ncbi:carbonic anhydrase [Azospirillum soli]|uniref:carbonic anhydrase n=1 Tax=Azospirillum soli TaxID=1304799 RepID=UPI001AE94C40|nr:carbonic anhydrase [Azospirillum soli]MBP2313124.1 carbonic anhydrase [Azospirillum soli]
MHIGGGHARHHDAHHSGEGCCRGEHNSRRSFLKIATLGAGAVLLAPMMGGKARAAGNVDALLLSCMDYRLVDDTARYMDGRGLTNNYDHVILAGASLGALTDQKKAWGEAFWDHVEVAKQLHRIKRVIVIDHRDCGAYRVFLGQDLKDDKARETEIHGEQLRKLAALVKEKHPDLEVELLLMALDGTVEPIAVAA